jgi:phosphoribosylaminoimidazolecarboxamide formyltransferase / IMP cyclohydrolase
VVKLKRVLISVSDKQGLPEFALGLSALGIEIISTGGTAKLLRKSGVSVRDVSEITGFPEMLGGRVKTLHPKVHGGILAIRSHPGHLDELKKQGIEEIDMVVVNLYPFSKTISRKDVKLDEVIEEIDIGGPSMIRSAAKNFASVAVLTRPDQYEEVLQELRLHQTKLSHKTLRRLAVEAFDLSAHYDATISGYLKKQLSDEKTDELPQNLRFRLRKIRDLRYGENPHQRGAFYLGEAQQSFLDWANVLGGKELSFNNIWDATAAWRIAQSLREKTVAIVKHGNPCGVASDSHFTKAYQAAYACDRESAFGGIVAVNGSVHADLADEFVKTFLEVVVADRFEKKSLEILRGKKNLRLVEAGPLLKDLADPFYLRQVPGGFLVQDGDRPDLAQEEFKLVTKNKLSREEKKGLKFAWRVCQFVHSNAIVIAKGAQTVGIGAGQMSRVESVRIACRRAASRANGAVLASDGFFPYPDNIEEAKRAGVTAIIQPGGSVKDQEVIDACDQLGISMVFTGTRHFLH